MVPAVEDAKTSWVCWTSPPVAGEQRMAQRESPGVTEGEAEAGRRAPGSM